MQTLDGFNLVGGVYTPRKHEKLSHFLQSSFQLSSRKDQLVGLIRESLEETLWFSCFNEVDSWSDEKKFQALDLLVAIIHPENQVSVAFFLN